METFISSFTKINRIVFLLVFQSSIAYSQDFPKELMKDKIMQSHLIVDGEIVDKNCFWDKSHTNIYTSYGLKVLKSIKGEKLTELQIIIKGGTIDNLSQFVTSTWEYDIGDHGIFLLERMDNNNICLYDSDKYMVVKGKYGFLNLGACRTFLFLN